MYKHLYLFVLLSFCLLKAYNTYACDPPELDGSFTICADADAQVDAGDGYISYAWSNGGTGQIEDFSAPGNYSVTVTDSDGCTAEASFEIEQFTVTIELVSTPEGCGGGVVSYIVTAEGLPEFPWFFRVERVAEDGTSIINLYQSGISNSTVIQVDVNTFQTTTFTLLEGFTPTCEAFVIMPDNFTVELNTQPDPEIVGGPFVCVGSIPEPTELSVEPEFSSYEWSTGETTPTIEANSGGIYSVTVTDDNGCTGETFILLSEIGDLFGFFIFGDNEICDGGEALLQGFPSEGGEIEWSTGEMGPSITVTEPGTYEATITGTCKESGSITVTEIDFSDVSISGPDQLCTGQSADLTVIGDFNTFIWSTGESTEIISINDPGVYSVTVSNSQGCEGEASIEITETEGIIPTIEQSGDLCPSGGTIELTVSDPFDIIEFEWSTGEITPSILISNPGTYSVTTVDINGCEATADIEVTVLPTNNIAILGPQSVCTNGEAELEASGTDLSLINWSTGDTNNPITVIGPGEYSVTVTDANNCTSTASVTLAEEAAPFVSIIGPNELCPSEESTLSVVFEGNGDITWFDGSSTPTTTVIGPGDYTVSVEFDNGCTNNAELNIPTASIVAPPISGPSSVCSGQTFILSVPDDFDEYEWSTDETTSSISPNEPGFYSLTVSINGCEAISEIIVSEDESFDIFITGDNVICDDEVSLSIDPSLNDIIWSTGDTDAQITISLQGIYTVTANDVSGCAGFGEIVIISSDLSEPEIIGPELLCPGGVVTVSTTETFSSYLWSTGSTESTISVDQPGVYSVTVTDVNGCSEENAISIGVGGDISVSIAGPDAICPGGTALLEGQSLADVIAYSWSNGATSDIIEVTASGIFELTVSDINGCTASDLIVLTDAPEPNVSIVGPSSICDGQVVSLIANTSADTYLWSTGDETSSIDISLPGIYELTVTADNGCTGFAFIEIIVDDQVNFDISGPTEICIGEEAILQAPSGFESYEWSTGDDSQVIVITEPGSYNVTIVEASGCEGSASIEVLEVPVASIEINFDGSLCQGEDIVLFPNTSIDNITWSNGETTDSIQVDMGGTYSLIGNDPNNGCSLVGEIQLEFNPLPSVNIIGPEGLCPEEEGSLEVMTDEGITIAWSNGSDDETITIEEGGSYSVSVTDDLGCQNIATFEVESFPSAEVSISGPSSLCPGSAITLSAVGEFESLVWNTGSENSQIEIDQPGTYSVEVESENGCTATAQTVISESDELDFDIDILSYNCDNQLSLSIDINLNNIEWSTGESANVINVTEDGTYTVSAEDGSGCSGVAEVTVSIPITETVIISGPTEICNNEEATLVATENFLEYEWSNGQSGNTITVNEPGIYTVTATDDQGCQSENSLELSRFDSPVIQFAEVQLLCDVEVTTISINDDFSTYTWSTGDVGSSSIVVDVIGFYSVTVTDNNDCIQEDSIEVEAGENFVIDIDVQGNLCDQDGLNLIVSIADSDVDPSYLWTTGEVSDVIQVSSPEMFGVTVSSDGFCDATGSINIEPSDSVFEVMELSFSCDPQEWQVDSILISNDAGCDTLIINEVLPADEASFTILNIDQGCPGDPVVFSFEVDGLAEGQISILGPSDSLLIIFEESTFTVTIDDASEGTYIISLLEAPENICFDQTEFNVTVSYDIFDFILNATEDESTGSYQLSVTNSQNISTIQWSPITGLSCTDCLSPVATPTSETTYTAIIIDVNGCTYQENITIAPTLTPQINNVYTPNAFTPNGDGLNDRFRFYADTNYRLEAFSIFDRWGNLIYGVEDVFINDASAAWDGTLRGLRLNPGIYVWMAVFEFGESNLQKLSGEVNLLE